MFRSAISIVIAVVALAFLATQTSAVIFMILTDEFDDTNLVHSFRETKSVKEFGEKLTALETRLFRFKERDFEALFGKPTARTANTFAMPVAQARGLGLSGIRYADENKNKNHEEFYLVGACAGLRVFYSLNGASPAAVIFYLRVNDQFPRLTRDNLEKRLEWEAKRWQLLLEFFERRRARVLVWEVDREAEKQFFQGDYARDMKTKLDSWLVSGKELGYRLEVTSSGSSTYWWYRVDGTLARYANLHDFRWYGRGGRDDPRRGEGGGTETHHWSWSRPDRGTRRDKEKTKGRVGGDGTTIRFETGAPNSWSWCSKEGAQVRHEWDDNGDGVPDWVSVGPKGKDQVLSLDKSWAVHPELIPQECRIPDQPDRRVPLRKIVVPPVTASGPVAKLTGAQLQQLWEDLAAPDHRRAYQAVEQLAGVPAQSIALLAGQVKPDATVDATEVARLIEDLRSERFAVRDRATQTLEKWRWLASPALKTALATETTLEGRLRLSRLMKKADAYYRAHLRRYSLAVKVLVLVDNAEAHRLLDQWAASAPEPSLAREARETVAWLLGDRKTPVSP